MSNLVSILIPCYNAEKWLSETLESALDQTWQNKEIIIVDDGSTDNSLAVINQFDSSIIKIISQKNQGAGVARNRALQEAQGDFVQFLDADDVLSIDKIESQIKVLLHDPDKVAVCQTLHFYDGEDYKCGSSSDDWCLYDTDDPIEFLIRLYGGDGHGGMIQPNSYLTSRNIIEKAGFWQEFYSPDDDGEYFCRVLLASTGIRFSEQGINYYRKHKNLENLSRSTSRKAMQGIMKSLDLKAQHLFEKTSSERAKFAIARMYAQIAVTSYPDYKDISLYSIEKAKKLGFNKIEYLGGTKSSLLAKYFGWKFARTVSYLWQKIKFNWSEIKNV